MANASSPLSAPPLTTPFIQNGRITAPWASWLQAWSTVASAVQSQQVQGDAETNNATTNGGGGTGGTSIADEAWAAVPSPGPPVSSSSPGRDDDGDTRLAAPWASEVAELRALVVAGDPLPIAYLNGLYDVAGAAAAVLATSLQKASNLSDLASATTARTNLGLGTAAVLASTAVLQAANNLSDVGTRLTAQTNLAGAYASWTPTITASGSMTVSSPTIVYATFIRFGPFVHLAGYVSCVLGGTASNTVSITLPVNAASVGGTQAITGFFSSGANNFAAGYAGIGNGASTLFIQPNNNANFALATTFFQFSALYRVS
jgi:hypothetical protein